MQPPLTPVPPDEPLYEAFYGLREQPFSLATDPRFLFMAGAHRRAYEELLTGLRRREGLLLLTGETGTGKTTLCRAVVDALGPRTFSALILNPYMSDAEVLRVILRDFGLVSREEIRRGAFAKADVPQLLDTLEGFLQSLVPLNSYAVVIIDEAQSLSARVLDQIRVLGSSELEGQRLLQIVLVGQPNLLATIQSEPLRALNERVSRRAVLGPLSPADVDAYIQHRLMIAGGKDSIAFTTDSVNLIASLTRGIPRRINLLCDRTLEAGRVEGTTTIHPAIVQKAALQIERQDAAAPSVQTPRAVSPPPPPAPHALDINELDELDLPIERDTDRDLSFDTSGADASSALPAMTFGQAPVTVSHPRRWGWILLLVLGLAGAGIGTVAARMYTDAVAAPQLPDLPAHPRLVPTVATTPFAPPTEHEERYLMRELQRQR